MKNNTEFKRLITTFRLQKEFCQEEKKKAKDILRSIKQVYIGIAVMFGIILIVLNGPIAKNTNINDLNLCIISEVIIFVFLYYITYLNLNWSFFEEYRNLLGTKQKIKDYLSSRKESSHVI